MAFQLTRGAIKRTYDNDTAHKPIVQIIDVKKMASKNPNSPDRYRIVISDGECYQQAMLVTQKNYIVESGKLKNFCICRLDKFICNMVAQRRIVIVLELEILDPTPTSVIDNPQPVAKAMASTNNNFRGQASASNQNQPPANYGQQPQNPASASCGSYGSGSNHGNNNKNNFSANNNGYGNNGGSNFGSGAPGGHGSKPRSFSTYGGNGNAYGSGGGPGNSSSSSSYNMMGGANQQHRNFHPISSLNPYQNKWVIKARVTHKGSMRTWSNARGEGKLFSVELLDEHGGRIRATMFNETAEKYDQMFQEGKVYTISRGQLKPANRKFNKLPHDYELTLGRDAEVQFYGEDKKIKLQHYDIKPLEHAQDLPVDSVIDVCGVIQSVEPVQQIVSNRTKRELTKRTMRICDDSGISIDLTIWGEKALEMDEKAMPEGTVVAATQVRVGDFGGRSLSTTFSSAVNLNPDIAHTARLKQWYQTTQGHGVRSLTENSMGGSRKGNRITIENVEDLKQTLTNEGKAEWFDLKATLIFCRKYEMDRPPWYQACPKEGCNKKVNQMHDDQYQCEKCNATYPECTLRSGNYIVF